MTTRWLFGDQLGPHFADDHDGRFLLVESRSATRARCLSHTLDSVAEHGWVHHVPRLMVLGSYALQRGWAPQEVTDWFRRSFVDGYGWVMVPNVVGMSQHADGGLLATKPYTSGGAYIDKMSDHCGSCTFDPRKRDRLKDLDVLVAQEVERGSRAP